MKTFARVMLVLFAATTALALAVPTWGAGVRSKKQISSQDMNDAVNNAYEQLYGQGYAIYTVASPMARTVPQNPRGKRAEPNTTIEEKAVNTQKGEAPKKAAVPDRFSAKYPVYDSREFQYFTEIDDGGNGKNVRTELAPLILASKFAVRVYRYERIEKVKQLLKDFGAKIDEVGTNSSLVGYANMVAEFPLGDQREILVKLNELARIADDDWDIAPLFYQKARVAAITGIDIELAVPVAKNELTQMLAFYAGVNADDLFVEEGRTSGNWKIRSNPSGPMFVYLRSMQENGKTTQKFDMHLVLLANLLETQRLFTGVTVKRARPVFTYVDGPIEASLAMAWPSDSIGGLRELSLTVTINDSSKARFDASNSKLQALGSPAFPLTALTGMMQDGWVKYAGEKDVEPMASGRWILRDTTTVPFGDGGSRTTYTFVWPFYVFQPEPDWQTGSLPVFYEEFDPSDKKWKPASILVEGVQFAVLAHSAKEGKVVMPAPATSSLPKDLGSFVSGPPVKRSTNAHWFSSVVAYATTAGASGVVVGATAISTLLVGLIAIFFSVAGMAKHSRAIEAGRQRPLPYPEKDEMAKFHKAMLPQSESVEAYFVALTLAHTLVEKLLIARVDGLSSGRITMPAVKEVRSANVADAPLSSALELAIALLERTNIIDAPKEGLDVDYLKEEFSAVSAGLPKLHELLLGLPPKMSEGTGDELVTWRI